MADRIQLQQVFMNLMLNGIEAMQGTDTGGQLTIRSQEGEGSQLLISVSDSGAGLEPEQADQIFNAFVTNQGSGYWHGTAH
jgi:signal transduction histidine kinase